MSTLSKVFLVAVFLFFLDAGVSLHYLIEERILEQEHTSRVIAISEREAE